MTPIARVSRRSRVAPTSKIDFTPAQTTVISSADNAVRSADSSNDSCAPRCTPPSPPVANTFIPAITARWAVAATVVAALFPKATAIARSRLDAFKMLSRVAIVTRSASLRPM